MSCTLCGTNEDTRFGVCFDCATKAEAQQPTVEQVCVIEGPGRGECWSCPVRACVLWQDSSNPFSPETQVVALAAARKLASRAKVISPATQDAQADLNGTALELVLAVSDPEVQASLLVQMAAEAVINDILRSDVIKRRNQYTDRWMKGLKGRMPTADDDAHLDDLMDRAEADAAAEAYDCDPAAVLKQLQFFRGRKIVRRGNAS